MRTIIPIIALSLCLTTAAAQEVKRDTLAPAVLTEDIRKPDRRTRTGIFKIEGNDFDFKAVMNTPDLIKTIQMIPGVTSGNEMTSGMIVRGGTGRDNLLLLDKVPIYQPAHFLGIFSVINTDMIKRADFYKGGYPAEFGGRASSVLDISTKEGDMTELKGSYSAGLTDGRFQIEGPMKKGKSSYNISLRQSWIEAWLRPVLYFTNTEPSYYSNSYTTLGNYSFTDLNSKFTWIISERDKVSLNTFLSYDFMSRAEKFGKSQSKDGHRWGNATVSAGWEHNTDNGTGVSSVLYVSDGFCNVFDNRKDFSANTMEKERAISNTLDIGIRTTARKTIGDRHNIIYGGSSSFRVFSPYTEYKRYELKASGITGNIESSKYTQGRNAFEAALYIEDEICIAPWLTAGVGARYILYAVKGKVYNKFEPRAALSINVMESLSFKLSYSRMNQFEHLITSSTTEIPGNFWMPSTRYTKPSKADQIALEIDWRPDRIWYFNISGYIKKMEDIYEYVGQNTMTPYYEGWENRLCEGEGLGYGSELYAEFRKGKWDLSAGYTLSWSLRHFEALYKGWFPDRYDNRHRLVLNAIFKADRLIDIYSTWTYRSGNRWTLHSHYYNTSTNGDGIVQPSSPYNFQFPDYHRLDLGINFKGKTRRRGNGYIVGFSVYNLYGRKNPLYAETIKNSYNKMEIVLTSVFPCLPSFRYTQKF